MKIEDMFPEIYKQSGDMRVLGRTADAEFDLVQYLTQRIGDCYSPEHCPDHLVSELATHIGFKYNTLKTLMYNRIVLKHFIKDLIRYRGSATGISNAAAIDIRYRQAYNDTMWDPDAINQEGEKGDWVEDLLSGQTIPMSYHEGIPIERTWLDVDNHNGIIYLFIIAEHFFPKVADDATPEEIEENYKEKMRRLLDLSHLQRYVRPAGMYLLPMVAKKVNPHTDLTVKAVRIPTEENTMNNGVIGTPNAALQHKYDRIHFAHVEDPNDTETTAEPWLRTLYHSQQAGKLDHQYFDKPVYHIRGNFLYYDHDELLSVYQEIMDKGTPGTMGMKVGDSLYNPNRLRGEQDFSFGPRPRPEYEDEPIPLQVANDQGLIKNPDGTNGLYDWNTKEVIPPGTDLSLHPDVYQTNLGDRMDSNGDWVPQYEPVPQNDYNTYLYAGQDRRVAENSELPPTGVASISSKHDDGTNRNLMINLFDETIDNIEVNGSIYTDENDIYIASKPSVPRSPVPYNPDTNDDPVGNQAVFTVRNSEGPEDEPSIP